jgi:hypothetical protein
MKNWKKMTFVFVLALVAGLCGGAWAQDGDHHDGPWGGYYASGPYAYGPNEGYGWYNYAHQIGYNDGVNDGRIDRRFNRGYRPERDGNFKHADHGYDHYYGNKRAYQAAYRDGYLEGYRSGFGR